MEGVGIILEATEVAAQTEGAAKMEGVGAILEGTVDLEDNRLGVLNERNRMIKVVK